MREHGAQYVCAFTCLVLSSTKLRCVADKV